MKKKILNGLLLMAFVVSSVSSFVACKDSDEDMYVDLISGQGSLEDSIKVHRGELNWLTDSLNAVRDSLANKEAALQAQLDSLKADMEQDSKEQEAEIEEAKSDAAAAAAAAEAASQAANQAMNSIDAILADQTATAEQIAALTTQLAIVQAMAEQALEAAQQQNCDCEDLKARVGALESLASMLPEQLGELTAQTAEALALAKWDSIQIANNIKRIEALESDNAANKEALEKLQKDLKTANDAIEALESKIDDVNQIATNALNKATEALNKVNVLETTVGELTTALEEGIKDLQEQIDAVKADVEKIRKDLDGLKKDIQNMITSIIVQAAESPVIGYVNTPIGLNATILAVYYGTPTADWDFPATNATPYLNGAKDFAKWTERNLEVLGSLSKVEGSLSGKAGETLITKDGMKGNAGSLYLTVNPASVNFEGQELKLMDSQNNEAPAKLERLEYTDKVLNFGYTRAEGNGFYKADATINDVEKAKINVDFGSIKEEAKDLLNDRSISNVIELGATLMKNASNMMPAYGVTASWTDQEGEQHNLYSQYNVAATAVKPLSLAFLNDWKGVSNVPGIGRLQDIVGRIIDNIRIDLNLPNIGDLDDIEFKDVTIDGIDFSTLKVKLTIRLDGDGEIKVVGENNDIFTVTIKNGEVTKVVRDKDGREFTTDENGYIEEAEIKNELIDDKWFLTCNYYFGEEMESIVKDLVEQFNGAIPDDLEDLFNELKKLDDINSSITDAKDDIKEQIGKYLTRINNKLASWINRAPQMLHLALVGNESNKVGLLSQSKTMPTKVKGGELKLIPTTYSLELVAPTYKKFVAVTDIYNADGTNAPIAKAQAANSGRNLAKVIEGDTTCTLNGEAGYIYEVTYTAVDYFGKVDIHKYYVKF